MVFGSKRWQSKIRGVLFESFEQSPIGSEKFGFSSQTEHLRPMAPRSPLIQYTSIGEVGDVSAYE